MASPSLGRPLRSLALVGLLLGAPMQCPAQREPQRVRVTAPEDAVYESAERLRLEGQAGAYRSTLEHIVERYPGTRAAARARDDLEEMRSAVGEE